MLTAKNMKDLSATTSEKEWDAVCDQIKIEHGGYPSDWFVVVMLSGFASRVRSKWK
jgi:hypothetical protein